MTPIARRAYGPTVRAIRESLGLGSAAVAGAAGLSAGFYSNFEKGRRRPTAEPTAAIARALAVDPEVITGQRPAIAAIRSALDIPAAALAVDFGISPRQLDRIERGTDVPDAELLERIARRLGIDPEALRADQINAAAAIRSA